MSVSIEKFDTSGGRSVRDFEGDRHLVIMRVMGSPRKDLCIRRRPHGFSVLDRIKSEIFDDVAVIAPLKSESREIKALFSILEDFLLFLVVDIVSSLISMEHIMKIYHSCGVI